jgi:hypothetical protein
MDAKIENGGDQSTAERRRLSAGSVAEPEVRTKAENEVRAPSGDAREPAVSTDHRPSGVVIPPMGESAVFGTSHRGYTLFHMVNLGEGDAEVHLTWLGPRAPQVVQMFTNKKSGFEIYREQFEGAKVAITNLSPDSHVRIRVTLCP